MLILPKRFEDVNGIINYHDPRSGRHATCLNIFDNYITPVIFYEITSFEKVYWSPDETDNPNYFPHKAGFVWTRDEYGSVQVPHKNLSDFPLKYSVPASWDSFYVDRPEGVRAYILPGAETLIISARIPQPAETDRILQLFKKNNYSPDCLPKPLKKTGVSTRANATKRKSHPVPKKITRKPRKPKPTAEAKVEPARRSVGREIRLAWIPPRIWEQMKADRLRMNEREVFRILYTFRKPPETGHRRSTGKSSLGSYYYTKTYQAQMVQMLKKRRRDILRDGNPDRKKQAEKMGTSIKTVKRCIKHLGILGYHFVVFYGYPKIMERISPERQAIREQRSETVPQSGPSKYAIATSIPEQKRFQIYDRICRDHGVRPCLFNLQKILGKSVSL